MTLVPSRTRLAAGQRGGSGRCGPPTDRQRTRTSVMRPSASADDLCRSRLEMGQTQPTRHLADYQRSAGVGHGHGRPLAAPPGTDQESSLIATPGIQQIRCQPVDRLKRTHERHAVISVVSGQRSAKYAFYDQSVPREQLKALARCGRVIERRSCSSVIVTALAAETSRPTTNLPSHRSPNRRTAALSTYYLNGIATHLGCYGEQSANSH